MPIPVAKDGDMLMGDREAPPVTISLATIPTVLVNGKPCAVNGSMGPVHGHDKHHPDYVNPTIIASSTTVMVGGKPIARLNDICQCGSMVLSASNNVLAG